jgi:hypothetical protein
MSIPKEVIQDLLPVYLAGEVSLVTRAWVEQQLARTPELAEQLRRQMTENIGSDLPPLPPPELELLALRRTRRMMALLRWLFGLGLAFSAIALALEITFRPLFRVRLLLFDNPVQLGTCLVVGVLCWVAYFALRSRLSAK